MMQPQKTQVGLVEPATLPVEPASNPAGGEVGPIVSNVDSIPNPHWIHVLMMNTRYGEGESTSLIAADFTHVRRGKAPCR